jgi:Xaa-Pro aminopeptidase
MGHHAELADLELPDFGMPTVEPVIPADTYRHRIEKLQNHAREEGHDAFVVYADREHSANLAYLTGFDARFEEALLVIDVDARGGKRPALLVGNEGIGYVGISPIKDDLDPILYQSFSLMGQERGESRELAEILRSSGVDRGDRVGVAGWKYFSPVEADAPGSRLEIPSYIADTLRILCGDDRLVRNANALLMHPTFGLRIVNDVDQLARFEFAATHTSQAVREVIFGLRPGMSEFEAAGLG